VTDSCMELVLAIDQQVLLKPALSSGKFIVVNSEFPHAKKSTRHLFLARLGVTKNAQVADRQESHGLLRVVPVVEMS
jgi:hypothetical protein